MSRRLLGVTLIVMLVVAAIAFASTGRLIVANVDGPPVSVEVVGVTNVSAACAGGAQTLWIPVFRLMPRDVVVSDSLRGVVLRKLTLTGDLVVLVRRDGVLYGEPGSSYGPAPTHGCA